MKTEMDKTVNNRNSLAAYSKFAIALLILKPTVSLSDVVYTDIEPDIVLANDGEEYTIDLNSDFISDFNFLNRLFSLGGYYTSGGSYEFLKIYERIIARTINDASFAGLEVDYGTTFSSLPRFVPYALNDNSSINSELIFQEVNQQLMAFKTTIDIFGSFIEYGGLWYPEVFDHYLGVRFKDSVENTHYGWIRCDVKDEGRTLVIKDYAYETTPDYPIVAGDTLEYVDVTEVNTTLDATVYSFGKNIYVNCELFLNSEIIIYDMKGNICFSQALTTKSQSINMAGFSPGVYLVLVRKENKQVNKKVIIE